MQDTLRITGFIELLLPFRNGLKKNLAT